MADGLVEMLDYNRWATATLLEHCRHVPNDLLDARLVGFSGTGRELVLHLVGGQQTFVLRTQARQHEGELNRDSAWPGWDEVLRIATETSDALVEIAPSLDGSQEVDLPYIGQRFRYPARFFLVHAVAHGAEHRTEIKLQLGQLGVETPDLDGWGYAEEQGYGAETPDSGSAVPD